MDLIRKRWTEILATAAAEVAIGSVAAWSLDEFLKYGLAKDIGVIAIWLAAILGGTLLLMTLFQRDSLSLHDEEGAVAENESRPIEATEDPRVSWLRNWDENQRRTWQSYTRLELLAVDCSRINEASSYVILKMVIRNFLLETIRLVKAIETSGTVDVHTLPSLPENYDVTVPACSDRIFEVKLGVHGTDIPAHLRSDASAQCPRALRWGIRGMWYVEAYGSVEVAWSPSHELACEVVPNAPATA